MDIIVLKFGGSSVANNDRLKLVANKIIQMKNENYKVVVIVSAQGKTTDELINSAKELTQKVEINEENMLKKEKTFENSEEREMDVLLSSGEQMSSAKLSLLLNKLGHKAISLTGWQAGIYTNNTNQNAIIEHIDITRIKQELENGKIVIIAGFQGINENMDITTLGRGGSDTTAVAISSALKAKHCYIYSDVDGVYTTDPNKYKNSKKLSSISYGEMYELASEGAKVLHNRCVEIADKYKIPIVTKSTFNHNEGTVISEKIEDNAIKGIVKKETSRISIVGNGIIRNFNNIHHILNVIDKEKLEMLNFEVSETKLTITFKDIINDDIVNKIQEKILESKD